MVRKCYHTQEHRNDILNNPISCINDNAWLGEGYYFWLEENDALFWGNVSKKKTGSYDVYVGEIECENVLDTVFNEEQYRFWVRNIEKAAKNFIRKTGFKPSIKEINDYFYDRGIWKHFDGIMFQDISKNETHYIVKQFQYKKRIQIVLFNLSKMTNFAHFFKGNCA